MTSSQLAILRITLLGSQLSDAGWPMPARPPLQRQQPDSRTPCGRLLPACGNSFIDVDEAAFAEALRPLEALRPPDDLTTADAATLEARIDSARARADTAARQLEELRAAGRLAWVSVSELAPDPIIEEEEIDPVLERIRQAIADQLGDGKHVRLQ